MRSTLKPLEDIEIPYVPQARWSRLFGYVGLPVLIIGGFGHRFGVMGTTAFFAVAGASFVLAAIALVLSIWSFSEIWRVGDRGFSDATRGLLSSLIALAPAAIAGYYVVSLPRLSEISTDLETPPGFVSLEAAETAKARPQPAIEAQTGAYPDIATRRFAAPPRIVFAAAERAARDLGWSFVYRLRSSEGSSRGRIEALVTTPVFGFVDEVVVRVRTDSIGSRIDIRSRSRIGAHDLGTNARRIRGFFAAFDTALKRVQAEGVEG